MCTSCVPHHSSHTLLELTEKFTQLTKQVVSAEFICKSLNLPGLDEITAVYYTLRATITQEAFSRASSFCSGYNSLIITEYPKYSRLNLYEIERMIKYESEPPSWDDEAVQYWLEWDTGIVHLFDLVTGTKMTSKIQEDFLVQPCSRSVLAGDSIHLFGGADRPREVVAIPMSSMSVEFKAAMLENHFNHCVVLFEGSVYVIGGSSANNVFSHFCEKYDIEKDSWSEFARTSLARNSSSAISMPSERSIYLVGGKNNEKVFSSLEKYSIDRDQWVLLDLVLREEVALAGLCVYPSTQDVIIVFAGNDNNRKAVKKSWEVNLTESRISELSSLQGKGGSVVEAPKVYKNRVYTFVFRNYKGRDQETFDLTQKVWSLDGYC